MVSGEAMKPAHTITAGGTAMFMNDDLGASLFKTWSSTQQREEIARLVEGYRSGLPVGILCNMAGTIAGSRKRARKFLHELMPLEERQRAVEGEAGGMLLIVREYLL